jgi:hypothetical protein
MMRRAFAACVVLIFLWLLPRAAEAYPQFQFSSGTERCFDCHFAPAGGGLINEWGRGEAGNRLSTFGGNGGFLHGLWAPPDWFAIGGDFRGAFVRNDVGDRISPQYAVFPMMGEVYLRGEIPNTGLSAYVAAGYRGTVRTPQGSSAPPIEGFISREHYLMWKKGGAQGTPYVRLGRFYAPYGLRLVEHIDYVRRYNRYNLYEETYNVSGGYVAKDWEAHVTALTSPPDSFPHSLGASGTHGSGAAVYGEKRLFSMTALGLQSRVTANDEQTFLQWGGIGKLWIEKAKLLFMGELDFGHHALKVGPGSPTQLVSYLGATVMPVTGLMIGVAHERYQEDLHISSTVRNAFDLQVNFLPYAHFELIALGRYQLIGSGSSDGDPAKMAMLQFHYYF